MTTRTKAEEFGYTESTDKFGSVTLLSADGQRLFVVSISHTQKGCSFTVVAASSARDAIGSTLLKTKIFSTAEIAIILSRVSIEEGTYFGSVDQARINEDGLQVGDCDIVIYAIEVGSVLLADLRRAMLGVDQQHIRKSNFN